MVNRRLTTAEICISGLRYYMYHDYTLSSVIIGRQYVTLLHLYCIADVEL